MAAPYVKTVWTTGDLVTQAKARNFEDGIESLSGGGVAIASQAALDFIYPSSASQLARLAKGAGKTAPRLNLGASAYEWVRAGAIDIYAPTLANVENTVTETTVLSFVIPGNAMSDGDVIDVWWSFLLKNNAVSPGAPVVKVNVGAGAQVTVQTGSWNASASEYAKFSLLCSMMRVGSDVWIVTNTTQDAFTRSTNRGISTPTNFTGDNTVSAKATLDYADATYYIKPQSALVRHIRST